MGDEDGVDLGKRRGWKRHGPSQVRDAAAKQRVDEEPHAVELEQDAPMAQPAEMGSRRASRRCYRCRPVAQTTRRGEVAPGPRSTFRPCDGSGRVVVSSRRGLVAIVCLTAASTACGDDKPAVCGKRDDLRTSVNNLLKTNPVSDGLGEVRTRLADVREQTTDLAKAAKDQYQPQVSALDEHRESDQALKSLGSSPSVSALAAIPSEVSNVQRDASALSTRSARPATDPMAGGGAPDGSA